MLAIMVAACRVIQQAEEQHACMSVRHGRSADGYDSQTMENFEVHRLSQSHREVNE